jgi:hypothetical protein
MNTDTLISKLEGVRKRGTDQWSARCPAHDDRGPSLSIRGLPDGRTLVHCFSGCSVEEVLGAMDLDMDALFPAKSQAGGGTAAVPRRRLLQPGQALELLLDEATLVAVAAGHIGGGVNLTEADIDRVMQAAGRIAYLRDEVML